MISRGLVDRILGQKMPITDLDLFTEALTHKSAAGSFGGRTQERLELLGDAVLSLCVSHMLFIKYPNESEGILTRMRTRMVNGKTLSQIGRAMGIRDGIILDPVAEKALQHDRIYEDTFEALVGAVYLDQGLETARHFVFRQFDLHVDAEVLLQDTNFKDVLRRLATEHNMQTPNYVVERGSDGLFECGLYMGDVIFAAEKGQTKKQAEMKAAERAVLDHFPDYSRNIL